MFANVPEQPPSAGQHEQGHAADQPGVGPGVAGFGYVCRGRGRNFLVFSGDFYLGVISVNFKFMLGIVQFVALRGVDFLIGVIAEGQILKGNYTVLIGFALGYYLSILVLDTERRASKRDGRAFL